jgi:hypothetical protein
LHLFVVLNKHGKKYHNNSLKIMPVEIYTKIVLS